MPITKPPVDQRDTENKEREILNAFLKLFFTGVTHDDDNGNAVIFPMVTIAFNQTDVRSLAQPLIHWNFGSRAHKFQPGDGGMTVQTDCLDTALVQTAVGTGAMDQADMLCAGVASNLVELLQSTQRLQLAQLGITRCRVMRGPTVMEMPGVRTRMLVIKSHLEYVIPRLAA